MSRSNRWCWTINNPESWRPTFNSQTMLYLVWEKEIGEMGTEHLQGYVRFKGRLRMNQVIAIFPRAHVSLARGSESQNQAYCSKDREAAGSDWGEEGIFMPEEGKQGRRSDLKEAIATLQDKGIDRVAQDHPEAFVKFHAGLQKLAETLTPKPPLMRDVKTVILWGQPGTGKTYRTMIKYPDSFKVRSGRDPFGDYRGEKCIVFDEFNYELWPIELMNELCDVYRLRLDCRYQNRWAYWEDIVIISNVNPGYWWQFAPDIKKQAFMRRVTKVFEVENKEQSIDF